MNNINNNGQQAERWVLLFLVMFGAGLATWLIVSDIPLTMDDGYYYFKIAQNLAAGDGSTFDGVNPTNGYHPLWLLCLLLVFWLANDPAQALLIGTAVQGIFLTVGVALTYGTVRLVFGRWAAVLTTLLWLFLTYRVYLGGLEFSLQALLLIAIIYGYVRWFHSELPQQKRFYFLLGILSALAFLARIDTLLLSGILAAWLSWRAWRGGALPTLYPHLLSFITPVLLAVLGYVAINLVYFGHPLPVSSAVKRDWSVYLLTQDPLYLAHGWLGAKFAHVLRPLRQFRAEWYVRGAALGTFGVGALWLLGLIGRRYRRWREWFASMVQPWGPFVLYSVLSYLALTLVYHAGLSFSGWYFVIQPWIGSAAVGALAMGWLEVGQPSGLGKPRVCSAIQRITLRHQRGCLATVSLILLSGLIMLGTMRGVLQWQRQAQGINSASPLLDGVVWARANLAADAVVGVWNAGTMGYLSERRVVNLDGVVNSWEFFETGQYDLCRYWDEMGITHLLDVFEGNEVLAAVPIYPRYAHCVERLVLIWSNDRYQATWEVHAYRVLPDEGQ